MNEVQIITDVKRFTIHLDSLTRMFEEGTAQAFTKALRIFGIDDSGNSCNVDDWVRGYCSVKIEFVSFEASTSMGGQDYTMYFNAWCEKNMEDEDE